MYIELDEDFAKLFLGKESVCFNEGIDGSDISWNGKELQKRNQYILEQIKEVFPELAKQFDYLY